ncbi:TIGR02444 family protein [Glaciecola sp. SC05]|uniref:TIGR02444 family protein n=1 Tax=Glaciecola sp. SC05 TaxID=1987355 RepID=UPI003527C5E7
MFSIDKDALWDYSLSVYKYDEVKSACLALQDGLQINVNIVLSMMYLSQHERMYNFDDIQRIEEAIEASDKRLWRHRAKRRGIKTVDLTLYKKALEEELALEKSQQAEIVTFANTLFFHYVRTREQLSDQLAALCLRKLTDTRAMQGKKLDHRTVSQECLKACASLSQYV